MCAHLSLHGLHLLLRPVRRPDRRDTITREHRFEGLGGIPRHCLVLALVTLLSFRRCGGRGLVWSARRFRRGGLCLLGGALHLHLLLHLLHHARHPRVVPHPPMPITYLPPPLLTAPAKSLTAGITRPLTPILMIANRATGRPETERSVCRIPPTPAFSISPPPLIFPWRPLLDALCHSAPLSPEPSLLTGFNFRVPYFLISPRRRLITTRQFSSRLDVPLQRLYPPGGVAAWEGCHERRAGEAPCWWGRSQWHVRAPRSCRLASGDSP